MRKNMSDGSFEEKAPSASEMFGAMEEHIVELRRRLIIAAGGLVLAVVICFFSAGRSWSCSAVPSAGCRN